MADVRTAVSLHGHTHCSWESLAYLPPYVRRIPVANGYFDRALERHQARYGEPFNFAKCWWRPPLGPRDVYESESRQISQTLGLTPLVSLTDHDDISAAAELNQQDAPAPISFEWSVPYGAALFHLGVHNLPAPTAAQLFRDLSAYTADPLHVDLDSLFQALDACPETLVVLNHPLWDLADVGGTAYTRVLKEFVSSYRPCLHAIEVNGYRSWSENQGARALALDHSLPVVAGGDRHGLEPNALLNLTNAGTFGEFVHEVRDDGHSDVVVMPAYRQPLNIRKLVLAADAIRSYPSAPESRRRWVDRVWVEWPAGQLHTVSAHWADGGPMWIRTVLLLVRAGCSRPLRPLLRGGLRMLDRPGDRPMKSIGLELEQELEVTT